MRIVLRLLLLGTSAAAGVALAISLIEMLPTEVGDTVAIASAAELVEEKEPPPVTEAMVEEAPVPPEPPPPLTPAANQLPAAVLPPVQPVSVAYQPQFTQELESLERSIRNLQDSHDLQRSQLRDTIDWLKSQPLPAAMREQLEAAGARQPQAALQIQPPAQAVYAPPDSPVNSQSAEAPPTERVPTAVRQEIQTNEGDDSLRLTLQNADLREVLDLLGQQAGLNILPSRNLQGQVSASISNVGVEEALNAILKSNGYTWRREGAFIYAGTREDLEAIDREDDQIATRVYRPNYVNAQEIQNLITNMLTAGVGAVTVSTAAEIDIPADNVHTGGNNFGGQDVVLVRDYERVLVQIDQVVQEIDVRPLQVAIEAMILSVKLDDANELGVNFELLRQNENIRLVSGGGLEALADLTFDGGLKVGFLDSNLAGFITALERVGQTNVIAKPHLMCLNKQRAEILIGEQLGYVSTTVTENAATQSVEFLEVGTQLRIRPFISSDGMIRMEVHPELSTGNVRVEQNFTLPDKDVTQVTTNIMCRDGGTIVIGGLIREDLAVNNNQVPVLGNLPLLGAVFRQQNESIDREELIVLITPRIVCEPAAHAAGAQAAHEYALHARDFADKMSPLGKRYAGEQYLRKARAAWNANDPYAALRYVNLAIHHDPQLLEATRLRDQIVSTTGVADPAIHRHLKEGLPPWEHPVREYSRQGVPWQTYPGADYADPLLEKGLGVYEQELGTPGGVRSIEPPPRAELLGPHIPEELPNPQRRSQ